MERRDARGDRLADLDLDVPLRAAIDTAMNRYPPERENPWRYGQFFIEGQRRFAWVRLEDGTYTELYVMD